MSQPAIPPPPCRASVIIAVRNRRDDLLECLHALARQPLEEMSTEVIVVDDASDDGTAAALAEFSRTVHPVRVISLEQPAGPSAARNEGARHASGGVFLFLDSDGVVTPGWLEAMLSRDDGNTVLLGCAVDYVGGAVQGLPRRATFLGKSLRCKAHRATTGPSCNLGVPRKCFETLGGFDEDIPYYFEDSDLCIRARKAGAHFAYIPAAVFRHKGSPRKKGDAIRMQEHNSTFAMLKAYRGQPLMLALFSVANAAWMLARLCLWTVQGRRQEAALLWRGWWSANQRFRRNTANAG